MSLTINSNNSVQTNTETAHAIKTAQLAKGQQEMEGHLALDLIQSAAGTQLASPPVGNSGHNINITV